MRSKFFKALLWSFAITLVGGASALAGVMAVIMGLAYFGDDSHLKKSAIMARINEETNIYMLDEETEIGSIFGAAHRRYVPIDEIPAHLINAIIAAEDKNFYSHHGVDPIAMFAAGMTKLGGGRMRGASTLTQQTVRNIMGWFEVSLARKFREIVAALQLERQYTKREILEFYLNQFYVSGNGNGIGIAARYYFNKEVRDLDLVESAFIAGSVKGPSAYDPFIKFTRENRERAIRNAYHRKNYVIKRMYEQGWISPQDFKTAWERPVKFSRGRFRSDEVALVQLVRGYLGRKEVLKRIGLEDATQLANAGLKIYTTIDPDMQKAGQLSVRRNLARLDTILSGFKPEREDTYKKLRSLTVNDFYYGKVEGIGGSAKEPELKLSFGLPTGTIPYDSLMRYAKIMDLPWNKGYQKQLADLMKQIKVGDVLYVEVKEYDVDKHEAICELMKRPRVNGGLIALDKGEVRAAISGFDTHGFNRAVAARRQPGSVFKPVVFFAALQLGWNIFDRLDNERQIFPYQGRYYYPRPDHDSPYRESSMLWAGIMSENLASVSLAARLLEKLNYDQFRQLLGVMELLPNAGEAARDYHYRVAKATGVQLDNDGVREYQLSNAIEDIVLDAQFGTSFDFTQKLRKMWYGRGYAPEMQNILLNDDDLPVRQRVEKLRLAQNNFSRMQALSLQLGNDWKVIQDAVDAKGAEAILTDVALRNIAERFKVLPGAGRPQLGYTAILDGERPSKPWKNAEDIERLLALPGRALSEVDLQAIWGGSMFGSAGIGLSDVLLDGWLPASQAGLLAQYLDKHYEEVMARNDDYDLARYYQHHDFRIGLGLKYLVALARAMGVTSHIEPVLSFPLGTNDVSLGEVAQIYQTFISGKTYKFFEEGPPNQLTLVRRIEDRAGSVLYKMERKEQQLVGGELALQMREILRRVVTHGTGRRAATELYLSLDDEQTKDPKGKKVKLGDGRIRIPSFGKTGTTNDYTNSNFAGFVPYPTVKNAPLDPENSYVLAAYVGYDLAKKMEAGYLRITGAQGALPAWIGLAKEIIDKKHYNEHLDTLDLSVMQSREWPLLADKRTSTTRVDLPRGVMLDRGGDADQIALTNIDKEGESSFDEYRANVIQAALRMPFDQQGQPYRAFSPFRLEAKDKEKEKGFYLRSPNTPEAKESVSTLTPERLGQDKGKDAAGGRASATSEPEGEDEDTRVYDDQGNRVNPAKPSKQPQQGASSPDVQDAGDTLQASKTEEEKPVAKVDADKDLFSTFVDPDVQAAGTKKGAGGDMPSDAKEQNSGFVEEELW